MRIQITFQSTDPVSFPVNYQYQVSSSVYHILSQSSQDYAHFLHESGYIGADGKMRKLYTFSFLRFLDRYRMVNGFFSLPAGSRINLIVSSPMLNDFIQNFVQGLFINQIFRIDQAAFCIIQVESLPEPVFASPTLFKPLSPIVVSTMKDTSTGRQTYYFRPEDPGLSEAVRQSLIKKHETAYGKKPENDQLKTIVDQAYVKKRKARGKSVSKLIVLKQYRTDETRIKGFVAPLIMTGSAELIKTAWECGVGDKCSMGFGCVYV